MRSLELSFFATREMAIEVGHHRNCQYCRHNCHHHHHNMFLCNQADGHRGGICCRSSASLSYFMIVIRIFHHCHNYHHHVMFLCNQWEDMLWTSSSLSSYFIIMIIMIIIIIIIIIILILSSSSSLWFCHNHHCFHIFLCTKVDRNSLTIIIET